MKRITNPTIRYFFTILDYIIKYEINKKKVNISLIAFLNIICLFLIPFTINYNVWIYDTLYLFIHEIEPMAFV